MREARRKWKLNGQPRGVIHSSDNQYKEAKRLFRRKHRFYAEQYLSSLNEELDRAVDVDPETFWKFINFNGSAYRCPKEIVQQWGYFFKDIYTLDLEKKKREIVSHRGNRAHCLSY